MEMGKINIYVEKKKKKAFYLFSMHFYNSLPLAHISIHHSFNVNYALSTPFPKTLSPPTSFKPPKPQKRNKPTHKKSNTNQPSLHYIILQYLNIIL